MGNLHLSVNDDIKNKAKGIAEKKGSNLSKLVEDFFLQLIREEEGEEVAPELLNRPKLHEPKSRKKAKEEYFKEKYGQ